MTYDETDTGMLDFRAVARVSLALAGVSLGCAQDPPAPAPPQAQTPPPAQAPANPNAPETTTREQAVTFRTGVNLVMVPVVVRDRQNRPVGGLQQEDFQLFDRGKPQLITKFAAEKYGKPIAPAAASAAKTTAASPDQPAPADLPERFVAYVFDDVHVSAGDLMHVREAASHHIDTLGPADRAAIYTTSGQTQQEFTDSRDELRAALARLMPRPLNRRNFNDCPDIGYYMADMIFNHQDSIAIQAAVVEALRCMNLDPQTQIQVARQAVDSTSARVVAEGFQETRVSFAVLREILRRMSAMPGQRVIILASPGFYAPESQSDKNDIMDRAIRYSVVINSIDARGLYTDSTSDASRPGPVAIDSLVVKDRYDRDAARIDADVLAELAHGTGGTFVENTNDLEGGFKRVASAPEYYYVLGFSPQNLKLDGGYHALKVTIKDPAGLATQARRGYYAPRHLNDAEEESREEIREAVFSKDELHELPIDLHTQFFKSTDVNARVTVLAHVDLKHLRFRKGDGRNYNNLTVTSVLFDRNGNYVVGTQKIVEMRLFDATLEKRADSGFTVRSTFDVKPGTYMVRLVVRDSEGQQMSAANGAVEIP